MRKFSHFFLVTKTVRDLRDELQYLLEPASYVGEVVKPMGKNKVLVKVKKRVLLLRYRNLFLHRNGTLLLYKETCLENVCVSV